MTPILNFSTIHIQNELHYAHQRIESGGDLSRPATEPKGRGANLRNEGIRPEGKLTLVLPNISRASSPLGGSVSSQDLFSFSGTSPTLKKKTADPEGELPH